MAVMSIDKLTPSAAAPPDDNVLWRHPNPESTPMWEFLQHVNKKHGLSLDGYPALYKWSIDEVALFWEEVWHFVGITASKPFDEVRQPQRWTLKKRKRGHIQPVEEHQLDI